jgi:hypothetical protein
MQLFAIQHTGQCPWQDIRSDVLCPAHALLLMLAALQTPASGAGMQTPATGTGTSARSRLSNSSIALLKTPATAKTPGTAGGLLRTAAKAAAAGAAGRAAADAGVGGVVASPAPLTISKTGPRSRLRGGAADENKVPGAAAGRFD